MESDLREGRQGPESLQLTVGAVAARLGVAVTTLRTWERRYGLGPSEHEPGRHRRYNATDLARLDAMRRLTHQGVPPAAAARTAAESTDPDRLASGSSTHSAAPHGGGSRALPLGRIDSKRSRGLARAALHLDAQAVRDTIMESLAARGTVATWTTLLVPVLRGIGHRWESRGDCVDAEHLLSREVAAAMRPGRQQGVLEAEKGRPTLLACAPGEDHALALEVLAAAASEHELPIVSLGARVPVAALLQAAERIHPATVVVWSQTEETGDVTPLHSLRDQGLATTLIAAGPGWPRSRLPAEVATPDTLIGALEQLQRTW